MAGLRIAFVIPALNEEATIGGVVERLRKFGCVIVVDDGSIDRTAEIAGELGAKVVSHRQNRGYDRALETGFARAADMGCEYVITMDADGQHPADLVPRFIAALQDGADLVIGIRDHVPRISERAFQYMTRALYGIQDPLCGMKGYRLELYRSLGWFDSYGSIGTELMLYAIRQGAKVVQCPVPTRVRHGHARIGNLFRANYIIFRAALLGLTKRHT
jgi:glycosyltransferase involved in cell wall biosynthesis